MRFYSASGFLAHVAQHGTKFSGSLDLQGCTGLTAAIFNCGKNNRTILPYNHPTKGRVISLGCFIGTKDEAIKAVKEKYSGQDALDYITKIELAFA